MQIIKKKKKKDNIFDGRTKAYREHRAKLEASRLRRQEALKKKNSNFVESVVKRIMLRIYLLVVVLGLVGGAIYGAKYYYDTTQNTISVLRENNAQLEVAVQTASESVNKLQGDIEKMASLNKSLQQDLQKAEAYGDELRAKLSKLNLVVEALKDAKVLEGKMNGATANLWRDFMGDTGGDAERGSSSVVARV